MQQGEGSAGFVLCVGLSLAHVTEVARLLGDASVVVAAADAEGALALLRTHDEVAPVSAVPAQRRPAGAVKVIEIASLRLDLAGREVCAGGARVHLSTREFDLLAALASDVGRVRSFEELTVRVWRTGYLGDPDPIVSAVKRLRKRIAAVPDVEIASVRGIGYRLQVSSLAS